MTQRPVQKMRFRQIGCRQKKKLRALAFLKLNWAIRTPSDTVRYSTTGTRLDKK